MKKKRRLTRNHRYNEKAYRPYTAAIGQLALAWNDLHEKLGTIFCTLLGAERYIALWNAPKFDRPKRDLLRALLSTVTQPEKNSAPRLIPDVTLLLNKTDALEEGRNNSVHTPLFWARGDLFYWATGEVTPPIDLGVWPDSSQGNVRAKSLAGKELLNTFKLWRDQVLYLRNFADAMDSALSAGAPWPRKFALPTEKPKSSRQGQRRRQSPK
jgi:hypothetical protein